MTGWPQVLKALAAYQDRKWAALSRRTRYELGLDVPNVKSHLELIWTAQFYREIAGEK